MPSGGTTSVRGRLAGCSGTEGQAVCSTTGAEAWRCTVACAARSAGSPAAPQPGTRTGLGTCAGEGAAAGPSPGWSTCQGPAAAAAVAAGAAPPPLPCSAAGRSLWRRPASQGAPLRCEGPLAEEVAADPGCAASPGRPAHRATNGREGGPRTLTSRLWALAGDGAAEQGNSTSRKLLMSLPMERSSAGDIPEKRHRALVDGPLLMSMSRADNHEKAPRAESPARSWRGTSTSICASRKRLKESRGSLSSTSVLLGKAECTD
mmetsp:Transcript_132091/g.368224  ORF Transcript_132091/g.368224 Transcript_132091/m.368224 type:complete len:262 (+) Transcript_132091:312-1097(+)